MLWGPSGTCGVLYSYSTAAGLQWSEQLVERRLRGSEAEVSAAGATRVHEDEVINVEDGDRCVRVQCSRLVCSTGLVGAWLNPIRLSLWVFV